MIANQQPGRMAKREWNHDLFGCFDDCGTLIYGYFCPCCMACDIAKATDESCCSCFLAGMVPIRTKIRTERAIEVRLLFMVTPFQILINNLI